MVPEPVHEPGAPVSFLPCCETAVTEGETAATGPAPPAGGGGGGGGGLPGGGVSAVAMRRVARLKPAREVEPPRAWTIATRECATSRRTTVCEDLTSPAIGAHARPFALQRIHW